MSIAFRPFVFISLICYILLLQACSFDYETLPITTQPPLYPFDDAESVDAGKSDSGLTDAGVPDSGFPDAGPTDAGIHDAGSTDAGSTDAGTPPVSGNEWVDAHNGYRRAVQPAASPPLPDLTWNPQAAQIAQSWVDTCPDGHNPNRGQLGENYAAAGGSFTPSDIVGWWASEVSDYNYENNSCSGVCGHYTQVVWRNTTSVGCAEKNCGGGYVWVCNYAPPGNYIGQRPY